MFIFREGEDVCIVGTHVDDLFVLCNEGGVRIRDRILCKLQERMEIDNRGEISYALDTCIEADRKRGILHISQQKYIDSLISRYNLTEAKGQETPGRHHKR